MMRYIIREIKGFPKIIKEFGFKYACMSYLYKTQKDKTKYIKFSSEYLSQQFSECWEKTKNISSKYIEKPIVWSMWWQGKDELPPILKITYNSHIQHIQNVGYQYIFLDKNNLHQYIDIPKFIQNKVDKGIISFTHLSDYIRIALLEKYGGAWIDITLLLIQDLPMEVFKHPFYSFNFPHSEHKLCGIGQKITECRWAGFMISTNEVHNEIINYLKLSLESYWNLYDNVIDYFLMNLLIRGLIDNQAALNFIIESIPKNNVNLYKLQELLNEKFDLELWNSIIPNQVFFKVTQKIELEEFKDGEPTYYNYIKREFW